MYHWDSCQRKNVAIDFDVSASSSTAMSDFRYRILVKFYDEGLRENFRLYTLPRDFTDVNQRSRIESWTEMLQYLTNIRQSITGSPLLYVFYNYDDLSPTKLPVPIEVQQHAANSESNSQSSKSSRDKRAADSVRERDGNSCVFCGYNYAASREAAHLFELKNCQGTIAVKEKQLNSLGLENINSISNMVSLCSNCHTKFDSYAIGIDPDQMAGCFFLKVSESIFDGVTQGGESFRKLHNKKFAFNGDDSFHPKLKLLVYRFKLFTDQEEKRKKLSEKNGNCISDTSSAKSKMKRRISMKNRSSGGDDDDDDSNNRTAKKTSLFTRPLSSIAKNCCSHCHPTRSGSNSCSRFVSNPSNASCSSCGHLEKYHT